MPRKKKSLSLIGYVPGWWEVSDFKFIGQPQFLDMPEILKEKKHFSPYEKSRKLKITFEEL